MNPRTTGLVRRSPAAWQPRGRAPVPPARYSRPVAGFVATMLAASGLALVDAGASAPVASAASPGLVVHRYQTSQGGDRLTQKADLTFTADTSDAQPDIVINPNRQLQAIDGFGATFNESGYSLLTKLPTSQQQSLMASIFNPTTGSGFSLARVPIGTNDFAFLPDYSADDVARGTTDFDLSAFSIARDKQRLIPFIKAAQAAGGQFRTFASPWSAPPWMKTNNSYFNGGCVIPPTSALTDPAACNGSTTSDPRYYTSYASYFSKYVQAMAAEGIPIDWIVPQNEPGYPAKFGSTTWNAAQMGAFIKDYLGPKFAADSILARIRGFEWNRDQYSFPKALLNDAGVREYLSGINWHNYECLAHCQPDNTTLVNTYHPGYSSWMSEYTSIDGTHPNYLDGEDWGKTIMTDLGTGEGGWIYWNLFLDSYGGPYAVNPDGTDRSGTQDPLIVIDTGTAAAPKTPSVTYLSKFYYLSHFSKWVRPGAYRIGSAGGSTEPAGDGDDTLLFHAFKNPDGSEVLIVMNTAEQGRSIKVAESGAEFTSDVAAHSINTFTWSAPVNSVHVRAGASTPWDTVASDPFAAESGFTGGATATTDHAIAGTADDPLYQSERYGDFSYATLLPAGRYAVTLKLSENRWNGPNQRVFSVSAEGQPALTGVDIYADAGGSFRPVDKQFVVSVTDGTLNLAFQSVVDDAKVDAVAIKPLDSAGESYTSHATAGVPANYHVAGDQLPGYVLAQDYNAGGEGVAYHVANPSGSSSSYRADSRNLEVCSNDTHCGGEGLDLGWLSDGDWFNFTRTITTGGNYDLILRTAGPNAGRVRIDLDGRPLGIVTVPGTGGYQAWADTPVNGVTLPKGEHTITLRILTGGFNLQNMLFNKVHLLAANNDIPAESYAGGGEGLGYHDTTPGNESAPGVPGFFRSEDVDLENSKEKRYDIGFTAAGEWLRYDVNSPSARSIDVRLRYASDTTGSRFGVAIDSPSATPVWQDLPSTGGWQSWADSGSATVSLPSGTHAIYIKTDTGGFNFSRVGIATGGYRLYEDPSKPVAARVKDLLGRMTLDDKLGQMVVAERGGLGSAADITKDRLGSVLSGAGSAPTPNTPTAWADMIDGFQQAAQATPLHIPLFYGVDAVHGHNNVVGATIFPHNIGLGATRDPALAEQIGRAVAEEMAGTGANWNFAPCVCVARNDRWGRTPESYGETPDLVSSMTPFVTGLQGTIGNASSIMATAKHYIGDGGTTGGTDQGNTELDEAALRDTHLAPFQAAVDANVGAVMVSYSSWNGVKMHGNQYLINTVLKNELGFKGVVVSDWSAIGQIDGQPGFSDEDAWKAVNAGIDMIMEPYDYKALIESLRRNVAIGIISSKRIDDAVTRILTKKFEYGLFEHPFANRSLTGSVGNASHRALARTAVQESQVLLKNSNGVLPLATTASKLFVAGKSADNIGYQSGGWTISWQGGSGPITTGTTVLQAIRGTVSPDTTVTYSADGTGITGSYTAAIAVIGETPYAESNGDRPGSMGLDSADLEVLSRLHASGVPVVVVLLSGRPLDIAAQLPSMDALLAGWLPGSEGAGVADVLFGVAAARGKLPVTWEQSASQEPINTGDGKTGLFDFGAGQSWPVSQPATDYIGAAYYSGQSGTQVELCTDTGCGQDVGAARAGDYLWFDDIDFGSTSPADVTTRIASASPATGTVQYRLDSLTGPLIAEQPLSNTGGWQTWASVTTPLTTSVTGKHRLYAVFASTAPDDLANLNWLRFN
jgi:beta-glucosidase